MDKKRSGAHSSLASAVAAAHVGDIIIVAPGTYDFLPLKAGLTIRAEGEVTVQGLRPLGPASAQAPPARLIGLTIKENNAPIKLPVPLVARDCKWLISGSAVMGGVTGFEIGAPVEFRDCEAGVNWGLPQSGVLFANVKEGGNLVFRNGIIGLADGSRSRVALVKVAPGGTAELAYNRIILHEAGGSRFQLVEAPAGAVTLQGNEVRAQNQTPSQVATFDWGSASEARFNSASLQPPGAWTMAPTSLALAAGNSMVNGTPGVTVPIRKVTDNAQLSSSDHIVLVEANKPINLTLPKTATLPQSQAGQLTNSQPLKLKNTARFGGHTHTIRAPAGCQYVGPERLTPDQLVELYNHGSIWYAV